MKLTTAINQRARVALHEISEHLETGIVPFWLERAIDAEFGGYLTGFDTRGEATGDTNKYIVTQTRMIWGLSALAANHPRRAEMLEAARQGVAFFIAHFWDDQYGGWRWKTARDGTNLDDGKVVYGQSFAVYALSQYALTSGDREALSFAERTFDLLQVHCADTLHGGYFENLERDWQPSEAGYAAGDRKSLDVHMHLMEAFTVLAQATGSALHRRKLAEVTELILERMIDPESGCGRNQFSLDFRPVPAINIRRTWNAERATGEVIAAPLDTTSYGHNVELAWLMGRALEVLGEVSARHAAAMKKLVDHALEFGLDREYGGVYRDGPHRGEAIVRDKEWWQNAEVLVGFLDAFERFGDEAYFEAFWTTWRFDHQFFINHSLGEWRQLLSRTGEVIVGDIGNPWKAIYHTGRSMLECQQRLERILKA